MTYFEIKNKLEELHQEIQNRVEEPENERYFMPDGAINLEKYFNSKIRVMWILKEAYDDDGGGWSMNQVFDSETNIFESIFEKNPNLKKTWFPIIYTSYGILNNFIKWRDMDFIEDDVSMCDILKEIAVINTQKLPSKKGTFTDYKDLGEAVSKYGDILQKQIKLLDPHILIFAKTLYLYQDMLNLDENYRTEDSFNYYLKDNKIYINAYHPSQFTIKREEYVNRIINISENSYIKSNETLK